MLVIYYLDSRGEAGLKNFMHAFCKANGSPGGIQSSVWERNERVLDINVSCSASLSYLFQTCQDLKGNFFFVFCHFSHHARKVMLLIQMCFRGVSNADSIQHLGRLCLFHSAFFPFFLPSFISFLVIF